MCRGSRKKELVDHRGDPKAIFTKIRQIIQWLPKWMLPQGFVWRTHSTEMKILNPDNDSSIIGEIGDQIGRGGRTTIYFKDESAHYEHPDLIEAALGDNTNVQVDISSVNGSANVFYRRRMAGVVWESANDNMAKGKVSVFIFDWRDHPGKTQEWYDLRRAVAEAEGLLHIFAQEVDRDYSGSVVGVIIKAEWVRSAIDAHVKLAALGDWFEGEHMAGQDIADGGGDCNAFVARHGSIVIAAEHWGGEAGDAARVAIPKCLENNIHEIYYDSIGVGAGFKTETNRMIEEPSWPPSLRVMQWNAAASPLDPSDPVIIGDDQSPTNVVSSVDTVGTIGAFQPQSITIGTTGSEIKYTPPCDFTELATIYLDTSATVSHLADVAVITATSSGTTMTVTAITGNLYVGATLATSSGVVTGAGSAPVRIAACPSGGCGTTTGT